MHMIAYTSHYLGDINDIEKVLADIVATAKENNPKHGITGVLIFDRDRFVQVIEGEKHELDGLLNIIKNDPRHDEIDVIFDVETEKQEFAEWNMDGFEIGGHSQLDEKLLENFRDTYLDNFKLSSVQIVGWIKKLIKDPERFSKVFTGSGEGA